MNVGDCFQKDLNIQNFAKFILKACFADDKQVEIIQAFNSTSTCILYDLLNTDNTYFEGMIYQKHQSELQLSKAYASDTGALFLDLHLSNSK